MLSRHWAYPSHLVNWGSSELHNIDRCVLRPSDPKGFGSRALGARVWLEKAMPPVLGKENGVMDSISRLDTRLLPARNLVEGGEYRYRVTLIESFLCFPMVSETG